MTQVGLGVLMGDDVEAASAMGHIGPGPRCVAWISHFTTPPAELVVLGMNATELAANQIATSTVLHDLNAEPQLPFADDSFDDVVCVVSVDYLTSPVDVFAEVARVLRPGGRFVCTFSNRCFPTKAIRGWLMATESQRCQIVATYFALSGAFETATIEDRSLNQPGDPLYAVWAVVTNEDSKNCDPA